LGNQRLDLEQRTVASSAIAAEAKMNIDPAARAICKVFSHCLSPLIFVHTPSDVLFPDIA
jgi:hypothetical protein